MKKTKSAVAYGLDALKVTPDELFKLIESSQGYEGENYDRWLASQIISIAEEDGVKYSQLLVKKFNIINDIIGEAGDSKLSDWAIDVLKSMSNSKHIYTVGIEELGESLDEVDWANGIDLDSENSFFIKEKLPVELQERLFRNEKTTLVFKLGTDSPKKSDLLADAKQQGISITSMGALLLYRVCNMAQAFNLSNIEFCIVCSVDFLSYKENEALLDYVLSVFKIKEGYTIKYTDLSNEISFSSKDTAFISLEMLSDADDMQDGVVLQEISQEDSDTDLYAVSGNYKRYSKSCLPMLNKISDESPNLTDSVWAESCDEVVKEKELGYKDALGYLNLNGTITLTSLPESGKRHIAITEDNLLDIVAYYGVTVSREAEHGFTTDIPCIIDGVEEYNELLYNCVPLFLFDYGSRFADRGIVTEGFGEKVRLRNKLDFTSETVQKLLEDGMPYFSFEAKELLELCMEFTKVKRNEIKIQERTFRELCPRDDQSINNMYESSLRKLKELVNSLSKGLI